MTLPLPTVADVEALPVDALDGVVLQLATLTAAVAARLATSAGARRAPMELDQLLDVDAAAALLATTPDYLRRHGRRLGLTVTLSPGQVRYSRRALGAFIARQTTAT